MGAKSIREEASLWPDKKTTKKTVAREPETQTMVGELIDEPKAKKTTKKAAKKA